MSPYYESGNITIYHGDCLEVLKALPVAHVGCIVTDPPYGINTKSDGSGKLNPWADLCNSAFWYAAWIAECRRVLHPEGSLWSCLNWRSLVTFQKASCDIGWPVASCLVWDKDWIGPARPDSLRPCFELVGLWAGERFTLRDRSARDIQRFKWSAHKPHGHPAEKPEALMRFCIRHGWPRRGSILDPFTGSGTTLAAAARLGAPAIGVELDERWCEEAAQRVERVRGEPLLPLGVGEMAEEHLPAIDEVLPLGF